MSGELERRQGNFADELEVVQRIDEHCIIRNTGDPEGPAVGGDAYPMRRRGRASGVALAAFDEASQALVAALREADPDDAAWTWSKDQTVGFILRRQAHEALIHRLDAELTATGHFSELEPALAADGVEKVELERPRAALLQAGAETEVLSLKAGEIQARNHDLEPAGVFGLPDRGTLEVGKAADVVVFDADTVAPGPLRRIRDFPADGERLVADQPVGVRHVLVNGTVIRADDAPVSVATGGLLCSVH